MYLYLFIPHKRRYKIYGRVKLIQISKLTETRKFIRSAGNPWLDSERHYKSSKLPF